MLKELNKMKEDSWKDDNFDYVTHQEFQTCIKDLKVEMRFSELRISKMMTKEITDTYWKVLPIMIGLMAIVNGVFFIAYKLN